MVQRFLSYSLDHNRPIRVLFDKTLKFSNITVVALTEDQVSYLKAGRKKPLTVPLADILSASYARGDDGDTLQYAKWEDEKHDETDR